MSVRILYFASLRDTMGRAEDILSIDGDITVSDLWQRVSGRSDFPDRLLCAINMEYATVDSRVRDGDEVAFFPPVTGG